MSDSVRPHWRRPTRLPRPWDSPGKNTRVGCHFLLQCMKGKSEVAQSCPTLRDPMVCSLPGSSVHGIFQARVLEWGAIAFSNKSQLKNVTYKQLAISVLEEGHHVIISSSCRCVCIGVCMCVDVYVCMCVYSMLHGFFGASLQSLSPQPHILSLKALLSTYYPLCGWRPFTKSL